MQDHRHRLMIPACSLHKHPRLSIQRKNVQRQMLQAIIVGKVIISTSRFPGRRLFRGSPVCVNGILNLLFPSTSYCGDNQRRMRGDDRTYQFLLNVCFRFAPVYPKIPQGKSYLYSTLRYSLKTLYLRLRIQSTLQLLQSHIMQFKSLAGALGHS